MFLHTDLLCPELRGRSRLSARPPERPSSRFFSNRASLPIRKTAGTFPGLQGSALHAATGAERILSPGVEMAAATQSRVVG
ncbi:MAG: hypothetical protein Q8M76_14375, partial [Spirochaetaceae bacterium]|nr:hypothetical protein [Spirochaetaceae bacterium]